MEVGLAPVATLAEAVEILEAAEISVEVEAVTLAVELAEISAEVEGTSAAEAVETSNTRRTRYTVSPFIFACSGNLTKNMNHPQNSG